MRHGNRVISVSITDRSVAEACTRGYVVSNSDPCPPVVSDFFSYGEDIEGRGGVHTWLHYFASTVSGARV